jgi:hypothetical protein
MTSIELNRGETKSILVTIKKDSVAQDITDYEITFSVKKSINDLDEDDNNALIKKELSKTDPESGEARLDLTSEDTFLPNGKYYYDIKIKHDGNVKFKDADEFIIKGVVTNR